MRACTPHFYSPIAVPHLLPPLYPSRSILQLYSFPFAIHPTVKYPCLSHFCTLLHLPLLAQVFRRALPPATTLPLITRHFASPAIPYRRRNSTANHPRCSILPPLHTSTVSLPVANQLSDFTQALLPRHYSISVFSALILN